jgi:malonate semialdehyde decarboxylase
MQRGVNVVVLQVVTRRRTQEDKQAFYQRLCSDLERECGLSPDDLIVSLVENGDADWSFGRGRAQFLTREL